MINEFKLENENIRELIKYLAATQGITMLKLKDQVNEKFNKHDSIRISEINFATKPLECQNF